MRDVGLGAIVAETTWSADRRANVRVNSTLASFKSAWALSAAKLFSRRTAWARSSRRLHPWGSVSPEDLRLRHCRIVT